MQSKKTLTKVDQNDPNTFVVCLECNTKHPQVTHTHLKHLHDMTLDQYVSKHKISKKQLSCKNVAELRKVTLENFIKKYGEREGKRKWEEYKQKQAYSNSFEYKQQKYGWTKEQYDSYNNTRASTKQNFIKRHGVENGTKKWAEYCKRQSYAGVTEEYFVEKYGCAEGSKKFKEVCAQKSNTLDTFIQRYGEIIGKEKWEHLAKQKAQYRRQSKLANNLFDSINQHLSTERQTSVFFDSKNYEYFFAKKGHKTMFVDFYCASSNKVIEFAGDYWHGNPKKYKPDFYNPQAKASAQTLLKNTLKRNETLINEYGCKVLLIWESDFIENREQIINQCIDFLNE